MTHFKSSDSEVSTDALFWLSILEKIRKEYTYGLDPLDWDQPMIEDFIRKMSLEIKSRFDDQPDLARSFGLDPANQKRLYNWGTINVDTFRNIFLKEKYNTKRKTRDKFAVLFGFLSAVDYTNQVLSSELCGN